MKAKEGRQQKNSLDKVDKETDILGLDEDKWIKEVYVMMYVTLNNAI